MTFQLASLKATVQGAQLIDGIVFMAQVCAMLSLKAAGEIRHLLSPSYEACRREGYAGACSTYDECTKNGFLPSYLLFTRGHMFKGLQVIF